MNEKDSFVEKKFIFKDCKGGYGKEMEAPI